KRCSVLLPVSWIPVQLPLETLQTIKFESYLVLPWFPVNVRYHFFLIPNPKSAVLPMFPLPNGNNFFATFNRITAGLERISPMRTGYSNDDCQIGNGKLTNSVSNRRSRVRPLPYNFPPD